MMTSEPSLHERIYGPGTVTRPDADYELRHYGDRVTRSCVHRQAEPVTLSSGEQVACICIKCWEQLPATYIAGQRERAEREAYCRHENDIDITMFGQVGQTFTCADCGRWRRT
jgi:hypothetical protein